MKTTDLGTKVEVGTKVRYAGLLSKYFTPGEVYEVTYVNNITGFYVKDDEGDEHYWGYRAVGEFFEVVEEEARKVMLTKAQDVALRSYLFHHGAKKTMEQSLVVDSFAAPYESLNSLSYMTVEQAISYGWDVYDREPYARDEYVLANVSGTILRILRPLGGQRYTAEVVLPGDGTTWEKGLQGRIEECNSRRATPEEVMFAKVGRKVGEFRDGDLYVDLAGRKFEVGEVLADYQAEEWFSSGDFSAFYPAESRVELPKGVGGANA